MKVQNTKNARVITKLYNQKHCSG